MEKSAAIGVDFSVLTLFYRLATCERTLRVPNGKSPPSTHNRINASNLQVVGKHTTAPIKVVLYLHIALIFREDFVACTMGCPITKIFSPRSIASQYRAVQSTQSADGSIVCRHKDSVCRHTVTRTWKDVSLYQFIIRQ